VFWEIEADKLADVLKIEDMVVKARVKKAFTKIKEEHAKEIERKEYESKGMSED
jgi:hypothetical protein